MDDRWESLRDYFRSRQGAAVNFAYVNAKGNSIRGFGIVYLVCDAHVVLKTRTARGYASFDYFRMPTLMRDMGIQVNHPLQAGYVPPSMGGESEEYRVEI